MSLRINDIAPDFTAQTDKGEIRFHEWIGDSWAIMFSHPKDFTPVCTTEFGSVAQLAEEWEKRGTKVIGLSVDGVDEHVQWKSDIASYAKADVTFPIIADKDLAVSKLYNMLPAEAYLPDGRTAADSESVRSVFIFSPDKRIQLVMSYPMSVGRNFAEILRALDALQATYKKPIAVGANWEKGDDVIVALSVSDEDAKAKYPDLDFKLPYLRTTKLAP